MTKWEYLTAPILTHAAKQILDTSAPGWELVQIAPGMNPSWPEELSIPVDQDLLRNQARVQTVVATPC
jgi:hypothetical protein